MKSNNLQLIKEIQLEENESAKEQLIEQNSGLIWSLAKRFFGRHAGLEPADYYQLGAIGLLRAAERFDLSLGLQFSTYAVPMIIGEIRRFVRDDGLIKISRSSKELSIKAAAAREKLSKTLAREPTLTEIAQEIGSTPEEIAEISEAICALTPISLEQSTDDNSKSVLDLAPAPGNLENDVTKKLALQQALSHLKPRDRQIIMLRFFNDKTQAEIGKMLGISQVQISRIEKKVLESLRAEF